MNGDIEIYLPRTMYGHIHWPTIHAATVVNSSKYAFVASSPKRASPTVLDPTAQIPMLNRHQSWGFCMCLHPRHSCR